MKKFNAFAGASQAYEAPEIETIEVRMEQSIASVCSAHQEDTCFSEHQQECPEDWDE